MMYNAIPHISQTLLLHCQSHAQNEKQCNLQWSKEPCYFNWHHHSENGKCFPLEEFVESSQFISKFQWIFTNPNDFVQHHR